MKIITTYILLVSLKEAGQIWQNIARNMMFDMY